MWMLFDTAGVGGWEGFSLHGFTLRASPAVTHGVSPPGTVGEHAISQRRVNAISGRADRIRVRADRLIVSENAIRILADNYNDY